MNTKKNKTKNKINQTKKKYKSNFLIVFKEIENARKIQVKINQNEFNLNHLQLPTHPNVININHLPLSNHKAYNILS